MEVTIFFDNLLVLCLPDDDNTQSWRLQTRLYVFFADLVRQTSPTYNENTEDKANG